ncbi:MAG: biotin/lipoyl-containing protein [candidate division Zixibacteria bacterium]|nr:biotin/lipoyl-containing protein [candidate division Zixibacteria bacterium]
MSSYEFLFDGDTVTSSVEMTDETYRVKIDDEEMELRQVSDNLFSVFIKGKRILIAAARDRNGTTYVDIDSALIELKEPSDDVFGEAGGEEGEKDKVFAPMPGKIVKLLVEVGDKVSEKQQLVIVEAMKMENPVLCRANGTVKAINFAVGDQVDSDSPIIELDIPE